MFTDLARKHVGVVSLSLTPQWSGQTTVTGLLDGNGASRLQPAGVGVDVGSHTSHVLSTAIGTGLQVAESSTLQFSPKASSDTSVGLDQPQSAGEQITFNARAGQTYTFTKYVGVFTSRDSSNPAADAQSESTKAASRGQSMLQSENASAWADIWKSGVSVTGDPALQTAINANTYQLYASIRSDSPDAIGPSGLSSDGYAGMVFWDSDIWMFPAILAAHPDVARAAVDYRFNTLAAAEHDAAANGYQGAFYPWTAGDDGLTGNDCYGTTTDSNDKILSDPNFSCSQELHLQADIAMAVWEYYKATGDTGWLRSHGWPVLRALADFWVSKAVPDPNGGYDISPIQPPDEYHTGVTNSAYTNAAAATALRDAIAAAQVLGDVTPGANWSSVADGVTKTIPFDSTQNIYDEYDGYNGEQVKQADVVMLTYPIDFQMPSGVGLNDLNYYAPRTDLQGPAMTDAIHSIDASALNAPGCSAYTYMLRSHEPFLRAPYDQFAETRTGPNTGFNFLTGVGGFLQVFEYGYSGLRFGTGAIRLDPSLSPQLQGVTLNNLHWQGRTFTLTIGPQSTKVSVSGGSLPIQTPAGNQTVPSGGSVTIPTRRPDLSSTSDLARCQSVTASSYIPGDEPVAAVDGSPATPWEPTSSQATLTVKLAKRKTLKSVTVTRGGAGSYGYSVETSTDGSTWHTVASGPANSSGVDTLTFSPTQAQYVRLDFPGGSGAATPEIDELDVTGP